MPGAWLQPVQSQSSPFNLSLFLALFLSLPLWQPRAKSRWQWPKLDNHKAPLPLLQFGSPFCLRPFWLPQKLWIFACWTGHENARHVLEACRKGKLGPCVCLSRCDSVVCGFPPLSAERNPKFCGPWAPTCEEEDGQLHFLELERAHGNVRGRDGSREGVLSQAKDVD